MSPVLNVLIALSDACRLRILGLLDGRELCVTELYAVIGISQPTASKHLGVLRRAGLVDSRRQGLWMYYRIASPDEPSVTVLRAIVAALRNTDVYTSDRRKLDRRSPTVVTPQAWHGTDPDFLD